MNRALFSPPLLTVAVAALGLSAVLHGLTLLSLGPWAASWPTLGTWPSAFHLWLAETVCFVVGLAALALNATRPHWQHWWSSMPGPARARALAFGLLLVQLALMAAFWLTRNQGMDRLGGLRAIFWFGGELRLHALFCVAQSWLASWLAWRVYRSDRRSAWLAAACICAYIGLDELLSLHEAVGGALRASGWLALDTARTIGLGAQLHVYAWQLVFGPIALGVGLWLLQAFWSALEPRSLILLVLAAVLFLAGALGFEAVQATSSVLRADWVGSDAQHLNLLAEESLETVGMTLAVFVFAQRAWR